MDVCISEMPWSEAIKEEVVMHVICSGQYNFFSVCEVINPISKMAALGRSRIHLHSILGSSLVQCKHTLFNLEIFSQNSND